MKARTRAAQIIAEVLAGQSLSGMLALRTASLPESQQPLCKELVYGALREWPLIESLIAALLQKPLKEKDGDIQALIGIGIYQLRHMRVPPHAAVSETVAAVAALRKSWARGLVNGVLRNYQRQESELETLLEPHQRAALPSWMFDRLAEQWPDHIDGIAAASRTHPPMFLRVNVQQGTRDDVIAALQANEIDATPHPHVHSAIRLETPVDVGVLPGFDSGKVSVQDASAQLAATLLRPGSDERVLDACAAPGGKSGHIAELMPDPSLLVAADVSAARLARIGENRDRLGLAFDIVECDARTPTVLDATGGFDAMLLDVPCSATGVLRRNPDVKVIRRLADIDNFNALQRDILTGVWPLLKPGGRLLYATCSLLPEENDDIVAWAASNLAGAEVIALEHEQAIPTQRGIQCLPSPVGGDGLYYALLQKLP